MFASQEHLFFWADVVPAIATQFESRTYTMFQDMAALTETEPRTWTMGRWWVPGWQQIFNADWTIDMPIIDGHQLPGLSPLQADETLGMPMYHNTSQTPPEKHVAIWAIQPNMHVDMWLESTQQAGTLHTILAAVPNDRRDWKSMPQNICNEGRGFAMWIGKSDLLPMRRSQYDKSRLTGRHRRERKIHTTR
jgi:hypothetical protein